jgi:hypothetical protein
MFPLFIGFLYGLGQKGVTLPDDIKDDIVSKHLMIVSS